MPRIKDQAIVVRATEWSETSQIVSLLTESHGLIRGLAKGSQRMSPSSVQRYSGGFELLTLGQVVGTVRGVTQLTTLTEWDLQGSFTHLRSDLASMRAGLYAADLVNVFVPERDPHPGAFAAMSDLLSAMAIALQREAALLAFQWRLLADCGYRPQIDVDARSGEVLVNRRSYTFDPQAGGLTHDAVDQSATLNRGPWRVRGQTVDLLRAIDRTPVGGAAECNEVSFNDEAAVRRANQLLCVYARAILDRELPTMRYVLGKNGE